MKASEMIQHVKDRIELYDKIKTLKLENNNLISKISQLESE